jgi:hypothetical protein
MNEKTGLSALILVLLGVGLGELWRVLRGSDKRSGFSGNPGCACRGSLYRCNCTPRRRGRR